MTITRSLKEVYTVRDKDFCSLEEAEKYKQMYIIIELISYCRKSSCDDTYAKNSLDSILAILLNNNITTREKLLTLKEEIDDN